MENDCRYRDDNDGGEDRRNRQKCNVNCHENDQNRALHGKGEHVARLRKHRRIARDRSDNPRAADIFDRQQLRMPYLVHKANANFMDDRFNLGSRRDGDVGLGLDE
jgi:hypothetical protein